MVHSWNLLAGGAASGEHYRSTNRTLGGSGRGTSQRQGKTLRGPGRHGVPNRFAARVPARAGHAGGIHEPSLRRGGFPSIVEGAGQRGVDRERTSGALSVAIAADRRATTMNLRTETADRRPTTMNPPTETVNQRTESVARPTETVNQRTGTVGRRTEAVNQRAESVVRPTESVDQRTESASPRFRHTARSRRTPDARRAQGGGAPPVEVRLRASGSGRDLASWPRASTDRRASWRRGDSTACWSSSRWPPATSASALSQSVQRPSRSCSPGWCRGFVSGRLGPERGRSGQFRARYLSRGSVCAQIPR
jgi:hypothetical protein